MDMVGNGFDFWNTMRRGADDDTLCGGVNVVAKQANSPVIRASGTSSCNPLSARKKWILPQPLGPMMAVTAGRQCERDALEHVIIAKKTERLRTGQRGGVRGGGWRRCGHTILFAMAAMGNQAFRWNRSRVKSGRRR